MFSAVCKTPKTGPYPDPTETCAYLITGALVLLFLLLLRKDLRSIFI